jgi:hypothetical protein
MDKKFKLSANEMRPLATGLGGCIATDKITVEGFPVRFMYREQPDNEDDSGWRFMSGYEDDEYMEEPDNHSIYDVNTIANYDQSVVSFLSAPIGSAFEKTQESERFVAVSDWRPPNE